VQKESFIKAVDNNARNENKADGAITAHKGRLFRLATSRNAAWPPSITAIRLATSRNASILLSSEVIAKQ